MANNSGVLFEMVCVAISQESKDLRVLVVNATEDFKRNGWILATEKDYSPIVAARMIPHDFIVCNELLSLEVVFGVLCNSAKRGVKKAIVIGNYDFEKNKQVKKHWDVVACPFGKNVHILNKLGKASHQRALETNRQFRSMVQTIRLMEKTRKFE